MIPTAYHAFGAIDRTCPEIGCHADPGQPCINAISQQPIKMPHIKRQKPETT